MLDKLMIRLLALCLFSFICANVYAFDLVGTWKLISIEKQDKTNTWEPDCHSPTGLLTYTASGYMAAGINCMKSTNSNEPSFNMQDMTFYIGKYTMNGNEVIHHVQNASDRNYYGKNLVRKLQVINKNQLVLIVKGKNENLVRLKWLRLSY